MAQECQKKSEGPPIGPKHVSGQVKSWMVVESRVLVLLWDPPADHDGLESPNS